MLRLDALTYSYTRGARALDRISLDLEAGHIVALFGENGAGKSTLLRLLAGAQAAQEGKIFMDGQDLAANWRLRQRVVLTTAEVFALKGARIVDMAELYAEVYPQFSFERFGAYLARFELQPKPKFARLSRGQAQQAQLAIALATGARLILIDEALDGLDVLKRKQLREMLVRHLAETPDCLIVIAGHNPREVEELCDQVLLLQAGRVLYYGDLDAFRPELGLDLETRLIHALEEGLPRSAAPSAAAAAAAVAAGKRPLTTPQAGAGRGPGRPGPGREA